MAEITNPYLSDHTGPEIDDAVRRAQDIQQTIAAAIAPKADKTALKTEEDRAKAAEQNLESTKASKTGLEAEIKRAQEAEQANADNIATLSGLKISLNQSGFYEPNGTISQNSKFSHSDYIKVNTGDRVVISGWSGNFYVANIVGFDEKKTFVSALSLGNNEKNLETTNIPEGIKYIAVTLANSSHENYKPIVAAILQSAQNSVNAEDLSKLVNKIEDVEKDLRTYIPFDGGNAYLNADGSRTLNDNCVITDFIPVNKDDVFEYLGYIGTPFTCVAGYSEASSFGTNTILLRGGSYTEPQTIRIPDGVKYIRACAKFRESGSVPYSLSVNSIVKLHNDDIDLRTLIDSLEDETKKVKVEIKEGLYTNINFSILGKYVNIEGVVADNPLFNCTDYIQVEEGSTIVYTGYSGSPAYLNAVIGFDENKQVVSSIIDAGGELTNATAKIPSGIKYIRASVANTSHSSYIPYSLYISGRISAIENRLKNIENGNHPLKGKKIAIVGDSISTIEGENAPYIKIGANDVGRTIESYVTWWDVWNDSNGTSAKNKTIGGVSITSAMIGTKRTFTPNSKDVGKMLGEAADYNPASTLVWSKQLCQMAECVIVSNASWSGSSMCSGQSGRYVLSHAWSDYTIGRLRQRDDNGNVIKPDVIFISRGTNDMTHIQGDGIYSVIDDYDISENGYPTTDVNDDGRYSFTRAYIMTIAKLRENFPDAMIYCCTLNVFKRIIYDRFPTRNGMYTLPQINDKIRAIADMMGCGVVEFDKDGITFENCYPKYISDSATTPTHPNSTGHEMMAKRAFADTKFAM